MSKHIAVLLFIPFEVAIILLLLEFSCHGFLYQKANDLSEYAIKLAEQEGGFTDSVKQKVAGRMHKDHLDVNGFTVQYITEGRKNYGETIEVNTTGTFTYRTLNVLGTGIGNFSKRINAPDMGYSTVWYRD
jgi:hypothetical protein